MPFRLFEYLFTPFGLYNAAQTFLMYDGLHFAWSPRYVFIHERFTSRISGQETQHFGGGIDLSSQPHRRNQNMPLPPQDIKQLQRFLGMVNFFRRSMPNCAQVLDPLTSLLRGGGGQKTLGVDRQST